MNNPPTFRLLDGVYLGDAQHTLARQNISIGSDGLKLAESSLPGGPLSLDARDGSLGRLGFPLGIAVDGEGTLHLLAEAESRILRYQEEPGGFVALEGLGGTGPDARNLDGPANIAIAGPNLYVADRGNRRVLAFHLRTLALVHIWSSLDAADVCSAAGVAYVLDQEMGLVYSVDPGKGSMRRRVHSPADKGRWSRVMVGLSGRIYMLDPAKNCLSVYTASGEAMGTVTVAGDVRHDFAVPPVMLNHQGLFLWKHAWFDRRGRVRSMDPSAPLGPALYQMSGVWTSEAINSGIYRCPWDRIEIDADLPAGTFYKVSTFTSNRSLSAADLESAAVVWETRFEASAVDDPESTAHTTEFLIQSQPGQYLWLRIALEGDGFATPTIRQLCVYFPRESYLQYLPAIYSANEQGRRFLENFLAVFQTEWDGLEQRNDQIAALFDPQAVPASHTDWLASLLALPLEESWTAEQKRRLLTAARHLYSRLGTLDGLQEYLRIYLENLGSPSPGHFPVVVEGFMRRRQMLALGHDALGRAGNGAPLWSAGVMGRLQLGEYSRVGEARMVSTGDPDTDLFSTYAHRFQVFVPSAPVKTASDERKLRRALDVAKPAHTDYELVLVSPRFRIGEQSSVGIDTVIGTYPSARLTGSGEDLSAPSSPPQNRLGYDTFLGHAAEEETQFQLTRRGVRAGVNTILN